MHKSHLLFCFKVGPFKLGYSAQKEYRSSDRTNAGNYRDGIITSKVKPQEESQKNNSYSD